MTPLPTHERPVTEAPSQEPDPSAPASREELAEYVRTNLIRAAIGIVLFSLVLLAVGKAFETELLAIAEAVYLSLGALGLAVALFVTDSIFSPMPPDVLLVVVANSTLHAHWPIVLPCAGMISALAGNFAWFLGTFFGRIRWTARFVTRIRVRYERPIRRFDRWAVVLGAITPLPFSLTCISAGALGMRWSRLAPVTLLRIPRFVIFYWVVYFSTAG